MSDAVAIPENGQVQAVSEWAREFDSAVSIITPDLVKGKDLRMQLVGVPFLISLVQFRKGVSRKGKINYTKEREFDAYATLTCQLPPRELLRVNKVNMRRVQFNLPPIAGWNDLPFDPESMLIINDGSTGIYRQTLQILENMNLITLPEGAKEGGKGETIYDTAPYEWVNADPSTADDNGGFLELDFIIKLAARKGLQPSEYESDHNPDGATTFYLA